ncbi:MAG: glycosyltransferase family 2 protein [Kiritimatiellia bacterium]|nr:glycosyltransferase family 2 protein [Lentisphaerota bacterium]
MKLSVVTTLYKSATFVGEFYERITRAAAARTDDYELIFVDDGSPDNSAAIVRELIKRDPHVVLIELARNFGHHHAALAGVHQARGDLVFFIDVDLEDQPEWLDLFMQAQASDGCDVVYARQSERAGGVFRRLSGNLFYRLFNLFSDTPIIPNICSACLMTRRFVEALRSLHERNLFMPGNLAWLGHRSRIITVQRRVRQTPSSYSLWRMLRLFANAITSFSAYPLQLIFMLGLILSLCFGGMGLYMLLKKLLFPRSVFFGYASIIVSIWFLGGVLILFIGVIGIYLAKIFTEVKQRPQYIVRQVCRQGAADDGKGDAS